MEPIWSLRSWPGMVVSRLPLASFSMAAVIAVTGEITIRLSKVARKTIMATTASSVAIAAARRNSRVAA
ncbi:hypothetical protein D3C87_1891010 [compost metagenome]